MPSKKFVLISPKNRTVWNFRGELIKEIAGLGYEIIVTGPDNAGIENILALGARFELLPLKKNGLSIAGDLRYLWKLYKLMRREKPDATLGYTIKPVIYGSIAARLAGVRNVNAMVTGTGYAFTADTRKARFIRALAGLLYKAGFMCARTVIFQNPDDRDDFVSRRLLKADKCRLVNGSGVNMQKFSPAPYPARVTFFMLSRMLRSKGVREYLEAAALVKAKFPQAHFMLLGAFEDMPDALKREEVQPYIDKGVVEYFAETNDVRPFYAQCSVYVLPSYREGTPRTVLEAMAVGRPVITTDTNGCRETVQDNVNGFLVPVRDFKAVAEKMIWFINNPKEIGNMGKESLLLCSKKFAVDRINNAMIQLMQL